MPFPSAALDVVDSFTGSNGPLDPTKWGDVAYGGGTVGISITGNQAVATTTAGAALGLAEHDANFEASIDLPTVTAGNLYVALFFSMTGGTGGSWEAYWVIVSETTWKLRKRVAGSTADLVVNGVAPQLASGDRIGVRRLDEAIEVYHYTSGAWNQTAVITASDGDLAAGGVFALDIQSTAWALDNLSAKALAGGVTGAVSLHVNADHPDADDDRLRSQVAEDTPLATVLKAWQLARAVDAESDDDSDEVVLWAAANADPTNSLDASVYAGFTHNYGQGFLSFGNNTGNKPILMRGVTAAGETPADRSEMPKWLGYDATLFGNHAFEWLNFGYEFDSGDDVLTIKNIVQNFDITWTNCAWTGGAYLIRNATGTLRWEDCEITSKISEFLGQGGRTLDGVGFKVVNSSEQGEDFQCHFEWVRCEIHDVEGEDGFQMGTGAPDQAGTYAHWEDCYWHDLVQPDDDANPTDIHLDCVQILGGPEYKFTNCRFQRTTSCIQASDFRNGLIHIENCMFEGASIEFPAKAGIPITIQGTDTFVMINNTVAHSGFGQAIKLNWRYEPSSGHTDIVWLNNILDGVIYTSSPVLGTVEMKNNLIGAAFGGFTLPVGNGNLQGFVEYGETDATILELANSPTTNPATDAGLSHASDVRVPLLDRLGRSRTGTGTDIGCHESPLSPPIEASGRPPYVLDLTPEGAGAAASVSPTARLLPVPGETIDVTTVNPASAFVQDRNYTLPAVVSLSAPDLNGYQTITINPKASVTPTVVEGDLYELVTYTAHLVDVADTAGNTIAPTSWQFTAAGPSGPAIRTSDASESPGWAIGYVT